MKKTHSQDLMCGEGKDGIFHVKIVSNSEVGRYSCIICMLLFEHNNNFLTRVAHLIVKVGRKTKTKRDAMAANGNHDSDVAVALTAPNGRKYIQPIGLFVNNEFVKSSNGQKLSTIYPVYEHLYVIFFFLI